MFPTECKGKSKVVLHILRNLENVEKLCVRIEITPFLPPTNAPLSTTAPPPTTALLPTNAPLSTPAPSSTTAPLSTPALPPTNAPQPSLSGPNALPPPTLKALEFHDSKAFVRLHMFYYRNREVMSGSRILLFNRYLSIHL